MADGAVPASSSLPVEDSVLPTLESLPERARSLATGTYRPVFWFEDKVWLLDQKILPHRIDLVACVTVADVVKCIKDMTVRGAPALAAAGAYGLALAATLSSATTSHELLEELRSAKATLDASRPTAVNLSWATRRVIDVLAAASDLPAPPSVAVAQALVLDEAHAVGEEDVAANRRMARLGADLVAPGDHLLHHCNTGAVATMDFGTALGVIYEAHQQGKGIHVWVDETRPRLQGARLTAWELMRAGVPMHLIADSASGLLLRTKRVQMVLFGADRVAANGDVANKVGTYNLSVVARENGVRVYAVVPTTTLDLSLATGDEIVIEERDADEVARIDGVRIAPEGCAVFNPAFDITPAKYLTGIITEEGVCYPPFELSLRVAKDAAERRVREAWEAKLRVLRGLS